MRVFIHSMYFLPEYGSAPVLMSELASSLVERGHTVEVITTFPRNSSEKAYRRKIYTRDIRSGYVVKRFWTPSHPSAIGRLIAWTVYTLWTMAHSLFVNKEDVLFLRLPPLQLAFTGILARYLRGTRFILNVQDIHPDLAVEAGILKNEMVIRFIKHVERWIYDRSSKVAVISEGFRKNLSAKGVSEKKLPIIPNWVDTRFMKPLPKQNPLAEKLSMNNKFVVMYSGTISISSCQTLERVLEVARLLRSYGDILFAIVGEGMKKKVIEEKASSLELENVRFFPFQIHEDLPHLLSASDVLLVPLDSSKSFLSVPSKFYTYMASGRPILALAEDDSESAQLIKQAQCGLCCRPEAIDQIQDAILYLKHMPERRRSLGNNGRKYVEAHYAKEKIMDTYNELLCAITA